MDVRSLRFPGARRAVSITWSYVRTTSRAPEFRALRPQHNKLRRTTRSRPAKTSSLLIDPCCLGSEMCRAGWCLPVQHPVEVLAMKGINHLVLASHDLEALRSA